MIDHFKNFQGFAPEGTFETFYRGGPVSTAMAILKQYTGVTAKLSIDTAADEGILKLEKWLEIPKGEDGFYKLMGNSLGKTSTDRILIEFPKRPPDNPNFNSYIIQKIVIGNQYVSQVERIL